ncbi:hypothetical protein [Mycolicibacterium sp. P1-18]|uniref:hypothetical protein n=1 Tax=Mycolicibacterium sp. P1-18 TaxID=2024615 RepID=UPI001564D332|nr:hypothetical protein [Mycolicibacterium sp. P1-18]
MVDERRDAHDVATPRSSPFRLMVGCGVAVTVVVLIAAGSLTHWFGLQTAGVSAGAMAASCEDAIRRDLTAPATAQFPQIEVHEDTLSEDDHVRLGADAGRVTTIWSVTGNVESRTPSQRLATSQFACRAAVFDDETIRASVTYGGADQAGQRTLRP